MQTLASSARLPAPHNRQANQLRLCTSVSSFTKELTLKLTELSPSSVTAECTSDTKYWTAPKNVPLSLFTLRGSPT